MVSESVLLRASALASTLCVDMYSQADNEELSDHREAAEMLARTLDHLSRLMAEEARQLGTDDV
ncbi:hypothetical protein [Corynebacterium striatum]|uniref:hypothetical protein n=1 Tax=Corynebacterium striatum TaxID=43770 RepID=UPI0027B91EC1|nr:hypothetical protein [Corynebacterium striatum]